MKKSPLILIIVYIFLNTSLIYPAPGNKEKKQSLSFFCSGNSHRQESIANGITEADIFIKCSGNGTLGVDIPLSVEEIQLTGSVSGNSHIYLYMRHNPKITNDIAVS